VQNCCTTCSFIFLSWPIDTDTQEKIGRMANQDHILYYFCSLHFEFWRLVIVIIWILQIIPGEISRIEIRWQNYFCLLFVFSFFTFLVTQLILRYIETGLLSRTIFLCPSGIMRYNRCYASLIFCHIYATLMHSSHHLIHKNVSVEFNDNFIKNTLSDCEWSRSEDLIRIYSSSLSQIPVYMACLCYPTEMLTEFEHALHLRKKLHYFMTFLQKKISIT